MPHGLVAGEGRGQAQPLPHLRLSQPLVSGSGYFCPLHVLERNAQSVLKSERSVGESKAGEEDGVLCGVWLQFGVGEASLPGKVSFGQVLQRAACPWQ